METGFTPLMSLAGGALIGLSAVLLMATLGRIMGATGVLTGVIIPYTRRDWSWRAAVLAGMISAPVLAALETGFRPEITVPGKGGDRICQTARDRGLSDAIDLWVSDRPRLRDRHLDFGHGEPGEGAELL